jgi:hypothetical protein
LRTTGAWERPHTLTAGTASYLTIDRANRPNYPVEIMTLTYRPKRSMQLCCRSKVSCCSAVILYVFYCAHPAIPMLSCDISLKLYLPAHTFAGPWAALLRRSHDGAHKQV